MYVYLCILYSDVKTGRGHEPPPSKVGVATPPPPSRAVLYMMLSDNIGNFSKNFPEKKSFAPSEVVLASDMHQ